MKQAIKQQISRFNIAIIDYKTSKYLMVSEYDMFIKVITRKLVRPRYIAW